LIGFESQSDILIFVFCLTLVGLQIPICAVVAAPFMGKNPLTLSDFTYFLSNHDIFYFCARNQVIGSVAQDQNFVLKNL
jgi:hypothetical protein